jgi:diacylglycerol kinase (ATP)
VNAGRRLAAIFNPTSGGGRNKRDLPLITGSLRGLGFVVDELPTERAGHATALAADAVERGFEVVCAIGGDGTVNEVINGIAGSGVTFAIIPTGTVNVLAMELGIPLDPPDACALAAAGHTIDIDLGIAGERYFALMAGAGLDAAVIAGMNPLMKKALREAAFAVQGVATALTGDFPLIRVEADERCIDGYFVVAGNSANYGGAFGITPTADMRDGLLDVCVMTDKSFLNMSYYWLSALVNTHLRSPRVEYFRATAMRMSLAPGESGEVLVQTDGEIAGRLPLDCHVVPRALNVITP